MQKNKTVIICCTQAGPLCAQADQILVMNKGKYCRKRKSDYELLELQGKNGYIFIKPNL